MLSCYSKIRVSIADLTIAIRIWENVELCFGQKYTLTSRLGREGARIKCWIDVWNRVFDSRVAPYENAHFTLLSHSFQIYRGCCKVS